MSRLARRKTMGRASARLLALFLIVLLGGASLIAQEEPEGQAPEVGQAASEGEQEPIVTTLEERVDVRLVELSFVALGPGDEPVRDLKPEDLRIELRGDEVGRVAFLERAAAPAERVYEGPPVSISLGVPGHSTASQELGGTPAGRRMIIFVDVQYDAENQRPSAARQLSGFVARHMRPGDLVAVLSYDGDVHVEQPFSASPAAVSKAIEDAYERPSRASIKMQKHVEIILDRLRHCAYDTGRPGQPGLNQFCAQQLMSTFVEETRGDIQDYHEALERIIRYAGTLHGEPIILAATHGKTHRPDKVFMAALEAVFGLNEDVISLSSSAAARAAYFQRLNRQLQRTALQESVVLYVLDRSNMPAGVVSAANAGGYQPGARPYRETYLLGQNDMASLALLTGGGLVRDFNVEYAAERAFRREEGRYKVGFYSTKPLRWDDLQRVKVRVERDDVRVESGAAIYNSARTERTLDGQFTFREAPGSLDERGRLAVPFDVRIDPRGLGYELAGSVMRGDFSAHLIAQAEDGTPVAESYHNFVHEYPLEVWEAGSEKPLVLPGQLIAPPGAYRVLLKLHALRTTKGGQLVGALALRDPRGEGAGAEVGAARGGVERPVEKGSAH